MNKAKLIEAIEDVTKDHPCTYCVFSDECGSEQKACTYFEEYLRCGRLVNYKKKAIYGTKKTIKVKLTRERSHKVFVRIYCGDKGDHKARQSYTWVKGDERGVFRIAKETKPLLGDSFEIHPVTDAGAVRFNLLIDQVEGEKALTPDELWDLESEISKEIMTGKISQRRADNKRRQAKEKMIATKKALEKAEKKLEALEAE